jgi:hypothetical protein
MRWAKTTKYQASVMINLKAYNIVCEGEAGEDYALSVNGEYIRDVSALPEYEELVQIIDEELMLEEEANIGFPRELERI